VEAQLHFHTITGLFERKIQLKATKVESFSLTDHFSETTDKSLNKQAITSEHGLSPPFMQFPSASISTAEFSVRTTTILLDVPMLAVLESVACQELLASETTCYICQGILAGFIRGNRLVSQCYRSCCLLTESSLGHANFSILIFPSFTSIVFVHK
jgi:hypothetical protein